AAVPSQELEWGSSAREGWRALQAPSTLALMLGKPQDLPCRVTDPGLARAIRRGPLLDEDLGIGDRRGRGSERLDVDVEDARRRMGGHLRQVDREAFAGLQHDLRAVAREDDEPEPAFVRDLD